MYKLTPATRAAVLKCLINGMSIRATTRVTGASKGAVLRLLAEAGEFAAFMHDQLVRKLPTVRVEADEQWSFVGAKARNAILPGHGDLWTFAALDADSKLVVSYLVGPRNYENTHAFMYDLAARTVGIIQLSTDGWTAYPGAVRAAFGWQRANYAQVIKEYEAHEETERRYSPPICTGCNKVRVIGRPDMAKVSTSYVENLNQHVRMNCKRFARLTNAHSKKAENHAHAVALNFFAHNFIRVHSTLTKQRGAKTTPAMASGLAASPLTVEDMVAMMDPKAVTVR